MYLTADAVTTAIHILNQQVHPFFGITFLACKANELSVGREERVSLDHLTHEHLSKYHRLDKRTKHFFQPFKSIRMWVSPRYASTGLQTANTQTFPSVFLHKKRSKTWGFAKDYVQQLSRILSENNFPERVPTWALAVWLYRDVEFDPSTEIRMIIEMFYEQFHISEHERRELFDDDISDFQLSMEPMFSETPLSMLEVLKKLPPAPDISNDPAGVLSKLIIENSELASQLELEFGDRLTLIAGDNGLGKSFLLEFAWWVATGVWAHRPAYPHVSSSVETPRVLYQLKEDGGQQVAGTFTFDFPRNMWSLNTSAPSIAALCLYARADGSFALCDPLRNRIHGISGQGVGHMTSDEVWNGRAGLVEGLIRDWVRWQQEPDSRSFSRFCDVLHRLSPQDLGELTPGPPIRIPGDPRDIPTIRHRYGVVPIVNASSGVQRILQLAYLIIWSWQEHELAAYQAQRAPMRRLIVFVDELEAHLHPKWQRIVLPSLMGIGEVLDGELTMQTIAATHSPMILASMEPTFDAERDRLYHLFAYSDKVRLDNVPFVKYGDASGWLTSPLFGLQHARSREAERAIERAKALQLEEDPDAQDVQELTNELRWVLSSEDSFWPRWLYFAESHGVVL